MNPILELDRQITLTHQRKKQIVDLAARYGLDESILQDQIYCIYNKVNYIVDAITQHRQRAQEIEMALLEACHMMNLPTIMLISVANAADIFHRVHDGFMCELEAFFERRQQGTDRPEHDCSAVLESIVDRCQQLLATVRQENLVVPLAARSTLQEMDENVEELWRETIGQ